MAEVREKISDLSKWAKSQATFLKVLPGESVEVTFKDFKIVPDTFNPGKEKIQYNFETEFGMKSMESSSTQLALALGSVKSGDKVKISRTGEGRNTKYTVEVL